METALDPTCDVIVACTNKTARDFIPITDFPVRLSFGWRRSGRMIKFLTEIKVTDRESNNFYHFNDNRVLPRPWTPSARRRRVGGSSQSSSSTSSTLTAPSRTRRPRKSFRNQKRRTSSADTRTAAVDVRSFALELSFDQGLSWQLADINVREQPRWADFGSGRQGHWCWCHWSMEVPVEKLLDPKCVEVCFRAVDQSMNKMDERPTWNVMGMLNNPWYRIRVHRAAKRRRASNIRASPVPPRAGGCKRWRPSVPRASCCGDAAKDSPRRLRPRLDLIYSTHVPQDFTRDPLSLTYRCRTP